MARISAEVIKALRATTEKLEQSNEYQWGHMGSCNCGFLAQEVTHLSKKEIHQRAMMQHGDWSEQLNDYCPTSGLPMDDVISELIAFGFDADDLKHLERLSSPHILQQFPLEKRDLRYNLKKDVIAYLKAWTAILEEQLIQKVTLQDLDRPILVESK